MSNEPIENHRSGENYLTFLAKLAIAKLQPSELVVTIFAITLFAIAVLTRSDIAVGGLIILMILYTAGYALGLFSERLKQPLLSKETYEDRDKVLRELRNYLLHMKSITPQDAQINIDEQFQNRLLARLTAESQNVLSSFVKSEVFKSAANENHKDIKLTEISENFNESIQKYQIDSTAWRKNANTNLFIGLTGAIAGIAIMWYSVYSIQIGTLETLRFDDIYKYATRAFLVILIESVSFFFLKLYREDRNMIRYFRNEITNLECKGTALKTALVFGKETDVSQILNTLGTTERNFLLKKGERVMSDIAYENSNILLEKTLEKIIDAMPQLRPAGSKGNQGKSDAAS